MTAVVIAVPVLEQSLRQMVHVQSLALACLNNVVLAAPDLPGSPDTLWQFICTVLARYMTTTPDMDTLEDLTSILWTLLRRVEENLSAVNPSEPQVAALTQVATQSSFGQVRANTIGCLGILARKIHNNKTQLAALAEIFLRGLTDSEPSVVAEALNAIFDNFAEVNNNDVFAKLGMMPLLMQSGANAEKWLQEQSVKGETSNFTFARMEEAFENLQSFVDYKKQQNM
eukprot:CAMPEP_0168517934 /NCGR_PEP_ID=MMETSP0405-20121227/6396_1 /TAXON_ID=498012 /ORGANISM="Trichosphaerium sp, Strain Am-I-7 wt" /LENGTH=227 /DNA_ID=CAMNT_0008538137 /DNA_START=476 /DNA_END=1159 /DNA_ORIENTATION=-